MAMKGGATAMMKHVSKQSVRVLSMVALALLATIGGGAHGQPLRVCADPDNLPFSKAEGNEHGLYIDLAERVASKLQRPIQYVWYDSSYQRRALRNTIQAGECDAYFALPADAEYRARGLQKSVGFLHVGYAVVAPTGFVFKRLDDLKGKRVAVAFASTPAVLLASIDGVTVVTQRTGGEALDSLARGEADLAFVWGPSAGYDIERRYRGRWQLTSVTGHGLGGPVSVAVRRDQPELLRAIDQALGGLQADIEGLATKYGFPLSKPVELERTSALAMGTRIAQASLSVMVWTGATPALRSVADAQGATKPERKASAKATKAQPAEAAQPAQTAAAVTAAVSADPMTKAGREKFNDTCSHCHSPDGASPMRERDLRRMKMRYDEKWVETAVKTINEGRPQLGMPTWKGALSDQEIDTIVSFLKTIQK
jgi:ABC-type amino acid transport substrate-binding protein/mono/diheme cytochrome c family protein